jgi:hypothetical protein
MDEGKWSEFYKSKRDIATSVVFFKVLTSDGKHWFSHIYDHWYDIKKHCEDNSLFVQEIQLQFRSNRTIIDVTDAKAVYFVRSCLGAIGQKTKDYFTVGKLLNDGRVHKQMWLVPELMMEKEYSDLLTNCFTEAIIYNEKAKQDGQE